MRHGPLLCDPSLHTLRCPHPDGNFKLVIYIISFCLCKFLFTFASPYLNSKKSLCNNQTYCLLLGIGQKFHLQFEPEGSVSDDDGKRKKEKKGRCDDQRVALERKESPKQHPSQVTFYSSNSIFMHVYFLPFVLTFFL